MVFGAIETGGTKTVMGILNCEGNILQCSTIPTDKPENTLSAMMIFLRKNMSLWEYHLLAIGFKPRIQHVWQYHLNSQRGWQMCHLEANCKLHSHSNWNRYRRYWCSSGRDNIRKCK